MPAAGSDREAVRSAKCKIDLPVELGYVLASAVRHPQAETGNVEHLRFARGTPRGTRG